MADISKLADPEFQKDFEQLSKEDQDAVLKSMGVSRTSLNLAPTVIKPFKNPDINKPVRKIDAQGADLPNRQQNDPRLIQPQDIATDQGVIPGVQTTAKIAAGIGTPLGVIGDVAGPTVAAIAANAPKIKAAVTGAALGGGSAALLGGGLKQTAEGALTGALGGSVGNKLLKALFAKFGPEAGAAMSEAVPGISQPIMPEALPSAPTSTLSPPTGIGPQFGPNPLGQMFSATGSTIPQAFKATTEVAAPTLERDLLTGKMLPKGVKAAEKLAEDVKGLTPAKLQDALAKAKARLDQEKAKQALIDMLKPKN